MWAWSIFLSPTSHLCRTLWNGSVGVFFVRASLLSQRTRGFAPSLLLTKTWAHTQLAFLLRFLCTYIWLVASVHNAVVFCRCLYFFFFHIHTTIVWHGTLGCFFAAVPVVVPLFPFLSADEVQTLPFHPLLAFFGLSFPIFEKTIFRRYLALSTCAHDAIFFCTATGAYYVLKLHRCSDNPRVGVNI